MIVTIIITVSVNTGSLVNSEESYSCNSNFSDTPVYESIKQGNGFTPHDTKSNEGGIKWKTKVGGMLSSPSISGENTIYVGSRDDYLVALDQNGSVKWKYEGEEFFLTATVGPNGTIYAGSIHTVYAFNRSGSLKWSVGIGKEIYGISEDPNLRIDSQIVVGSDNTVFVGCTKNRLYAINTTSGEKKWYVQKPYEDSIYSFSSPAIGSDGTIYAGSDDNNIYAFYPNGTEKWSFNTGGNVLSPTIGDEGIIYAGSSDHNVYALNKDGSLLWKHKIDDSPSPSLAIGPDGTIYSGGDKLYAINQDGSLKWSYNPGLLYLSVRSPIVSADGTVYAASADTLLAVDDEGKLKWKCFTGGWAHPIELFFGDGSISDSPSIGSDGTIYVSTEDGMIYAIGGERTFLKSYSWVIFSMIILVGIIFGITVLVYLLRKNRSPLGVILYSILFFLHGLFHSFIVFIETTIRTYIVGVEIIWVLGSIVLAMISFVTVYYLVRGKRKDRGKIKNISTLGVISILGFTLLMAIINMRAVILFLPSLIILLVPFWYLDKSNAVEYFSRDYNSQKPDCFGDHDGKSYECQVCEYEEECEKESSV